LFIFSSIILKNKRSIYMRAVLSCTCCMIQYFFN
jgi:hypothetical protein